MNLVSAEIVPTKFSYIHKLSTDVELWWSYETCVVVAIGEGLLPSSSQEKSQMIIDTCYG